MIRRRSQRDREELGAVARQQAAAADLGQRALEGMPLDRLLQEAAAVTARELRSDTVSILELTGDGQGLSVRAGFGLAEGAEGGVMPVEDELLPGHALRAGEAVPIADFSFERRFPTTPTSCRPSATWSAPPSSALAWRSACATARRASASSPTRRRR